MVPTTAPPALPWAALPAGPALTCPFARTLQQAQGNVGRGDRGQLAKGAA